MSEMSETKPRILICATSAYGHVMPLRAIARELVTNGFDVTFLTGSDYKEKIELIGAKFVSLTGPSNITQAALDAIMLKLRNAPPTHSEIGVIGAFLNTIPSQHEGVQRAIQEMTGNDPDARIVLLYESCFMGAQPTQFGALGLEPLAYIAIGVIPVVLSSIDTAPFGLGRQPDMSPEGKARNMAAHERDHVERKFQSQARYQEVLRDLGATVPDVFWSDSPYLTATRFVQMCPESIEYPRSDAPSTFRFSGGLVGRQQRDHPEILPSWWGDVSNKGDKKIIFVCQGTFATVPTDLTIPTMAALKDERNIIVVAALGKEGATLPKGTDVPVNARVVDFLPYDDILEYADIFIGNGGYGSIQHSLGSGVPMIIAGQGQDKPDNAMRVEWAGVGIDMKTGRPLSEQLHKAVMEMLADRKYKKRAMEIKEEMDSADPMGAIIETIQEVAGL